MSYAIIGFGNIGQALARAFARNGIEVSVATTRDPESFASAAAAIGPTIIPKILREAVARGRIKATNREFEDDWIFAITVRDADLTNIREYVDTQALARAAAMSGPENAADQPDDGSHLRAS
ncbi:MAG: NAD(P)-binding domain-containing protein [Pseudomonadota bacterium]